MEHEFDTEITSPLDQYILSHDTLLSTKIDQSITLPGWSLENHHPPTTTTTPESKRELFLRGIPPALRCSTYVSSIRWSITLNKEARRQQYYSNNNKKAPTSFEECQKSVGTLRNVRILDHGWKVALKGIFPDESDVYQASVPDFGLGQRYMNNLLTRDHNGGMPIPTSNNSSSTGGGILSLKKVLCAADRSLGMEYCPLLPDLTALLLCIMDESYTYWSIREMLEDSNHFFPTSRIEHLALCRTFADLTRRLFPQTHAVMEGIGAMKPSALDPIFKRFFVTVFRKEHVFRILDLFVLDGVEVLLRIGSSLVCLFHAHLTDFDCGDGLLWWVGVRRFARSKHFNFDVFLEKQAFGFHQGRFRKRPIFPGRDVVRRLVGRNEEWVRDNVSSRHLTNTSGGEYDEEDEDGMMPLGFVEDPKIPIVLPKNATERMKLAEWMPDSLKSTNLDLIFSSSVHGRTVQLFYNRCRDARHTITLMEVFPSSRDKAAEAAAAAESGDEEQQDRLTVGMFATQTWHNNPKGYGDGECFVFRLQPDPVCFKWNPFLLHGHHHQHLQQQQQQQQHDDDHNGQHHQQQQQDEDYYDIYAKTASFDNEDAAKQAKMTEQIMISGDDFISMGVGKDGSSGLRLNEDLTKGSTSPSLLSTDGKMEPLLGRFADKETKRGEEEEEEGGDLQVFDIGLIEVYRLVREVDGRPVDQVDPWKGLFD